MGIYIMAPVTTITAAPKMFGAYVSNISTSIGWGGQGGSCQLTLVEDPLNGVTIALPQVGTACYFKFQGFYFGGVFQRWTYKESTSGRTYDIVLESPSKLLDGLQIITDEFEGTAFNIGPGYDRFNAAYNPNFTNQINNVYNPFAHEENYAFGGNFGKANVNSAGFPAPRLLELIEIISKGESSFGGPAIFGESEYTIDLTELKAVVPQYFRIKGPVQNLNAILQECTEIVQHDYFVTITGVESTDEGSSTTTPPVDTTAGRASSRAPTGGTRGESARAVSRPPVGGLSADAIDNGGGTIQNPIIEIKLIDKGQQPTPGLIKSMVANAKGDTLVSSSVGEELSDTSTQKLVIGGAASRYYEVPIGNCIPVWGKNAASQYIMSPNLATVSTAYAPNASVPILLDDYSAGATYTATIFELRLALGGQEAWQTYKVFESIKNDTFDRDPWSVGVEANTLMFAEMIAGRRGPLNLASTSATAAQKAYNETLQKYVQNIYSGVKKAADQFYGQIFLAPLPYEPGGIDNNLRWIAEDIQYETSWDISESAYTTALPIPDVSFYDGDGKLKSVAVWTSSSSFDYSNLGSDYSFTTSGTLASSKGGPEKDIYWIFGLPYVIVNAGSQVRNHDSLTTPDFGLSVLTAYVFRESIPPAAYIGPGKANTQIQIAPDAAPPISFGIPQQSNRYKWGPWYAYGALNGKAEVLVDESLKPETFGSNTMMDEAAFAIAFAGIAAMTAAESGYIELAEFPDYNIADRFAGGGPYVTNLDMSIGSDGVKTTYKFNTWTPNFGKMAKYNIDRISRINKASLAFMQTERGKVQKKPFPKQKFEKSDPKDLASRLTTNRPSSAMQIFKFFLNPHPEGSNVELGDAGSNVIDSYDSSSGCTLEQQWTPISITKGLKADDPTPGFRPPALLPQSIGGGQFSAFNSETGPFGDGDFVGPTNRELNPYFSNILGGDGSHWMENNDYMAVVHGDSSGETKDLSLPKLSESERGKIESVRPLALRGPLLLSGWGFDIADQAVPTSDVSDAGIPQFDPDVVNQRSTWKTGPVHLMWDDERQVWAGGLQIVGGKLKTDIVSGGLSNPSTFTVEVLRKDGNSSKGDPLVSQGETITCYNRDETLAQAATGDIWVIAIRLNYEWVPLWVGCPVT